MKRIAFASDNAAGAHPAVLEAMQRVNDGHVFAYGDDPHTGRAAHLLQQALGTDAVPIFVFGGTGANVIALDAMLLPHESVLCAATAHINVDECGAPERHIGCKLVPVEAPDGKLTPELIAPFVRGIGVEHHAQPRVISISQSTEYGTVYQVEEIRALAAFAHSHEIFLHIDGARIANGVASLGTGLAALVTGTGVDALSFGATKNGAVGAEAVVLFRPEHARRLAYARKQAMQLPSKMRFIAAQIEAMLTDGLWLANAQHANAMAKRLADGIRTVDGVELTQSVEANAVFTVLSDTCLERLREHYEFEMWDSQRNEVRWMTAWDTDADDVDVFVRLVREKR